MPLDLTDFTEQSFDPVPAGRYFAYVNDIEERETGGTGKMPEGTPMIWVEFVMTGKVGDDDGPNEDSEFFGRRQWRNMVIPPADYEDVRARKAMNGMIVSFFKALGFDEADIASGTFEPDYEELKEMPLVIQVNRKPNRETKELQNNVVAFKSMEDVAGEVSDVV